MEVLTAYALPGNVREMENVITRAHPVSRACARGRLRVDRPRLGLNPSTLYFRMKKLGVKRPSGPIARPRS
jgi:transcriptional regulator of acetoin/glycerol metabolism